MDVIPELDPSEDLKIRTPEMESIRKKIEVLQGRLSSHPLHKHKDTDRFLELYVKKMELVEEHKMLKKEIKTAKSILQVTRYKC